MREACQPFASRLLDVFSSSFFFFSPLTLFIGRVPSSSVPDCDPETLFLFLFSDLDTVVVEEGVEEAGMIFVVMRAAEADGRLGGEAGLTLGGLLWRFSTSFSSVERAVKKVIQSMALFAEPPSAALTALAFSLFSASPASISFFSFSFCFSFLASFLAFFSASLASLSFLSLLLSFFSFFLLLLSLKSFFIFIVEAGVILVLGCRLDGLGIGICDEG